MYIFYAMSHDEVLRKYDKIEKSDQILFYPAVSYASDATKNNLIICTFFKGILCLYF